MSWFYGLFTIESVGSWIAFASFAVAVPAFMLWERLRLRSISKIKILKALTIPSVYADRLWSIWFGCQTTLLIFTQLRLLQSSCTFIKDLVCVSVCVSRLWAVLIGACENTIKFLLTSLKSEIDSLRLRRNFESAENSWTTAWRSFTLSLSERRFLYLWSLRYISSPSRWFFIVLKLPTSLGRSFRSSFSVFVLIDINFWTVNFPALNVRVLQGHHLSIVAPRSKVGRLGRSFGRVLIV